MIRHWFVLLFAVSCSSSPVLADQSYKKRLVEHLNKFKQYPASANARHASGESLVTFSVDREGKITSSSVVKSSGELDLDQASLEMLIRAQPLPPLPADMTNNPEKFTLPVIFRSKAAMESSSPDIDLSAFMTGTCKTLKLAGRDFTCKSVSYFHTKQGRANFTVVLDNTADDGHVVSFSGANGRKVNEDLYELPIDRMLLNSKDRPKISGLPVPLVEPSAGICKQLGNFPARQVSSITCTVMDRNGNQYELAFESDGSPISAKGPKDERISQSTPTISQTPTPSKSSVSLPPAIRAATNEEMKDCGAKEIPEAAVTSLDLNGDGVNDYIIDFEKIFENVSGCSCGSAGCPRDFWVSETGSFVKSFSQKIQGIERIENGLQGQTVILGTHGSTCNQVGSNACYFKLTWAGSKAMIEPLNSTAQSQNSEARGSHLGKWYASDPAVCSNHPDDLNLGLLVYGTKEVWGPDERGCQILKSVSRATKVDLTMRCSVEGTTSAKPEHETLEVVGGKLKLTFREGRKQRTFTYNRCPAETESKLHYGSRAGMTVTVVSKSGINGDRAVIKTKHTKEDAIGFCREYVGKVTEKCIQDEMAIRLRDEITGNCLTGRFTNFAGEDHQYLGAMKPKNDDTFAKYVIRNLANGQIADGSMGSGYPTNMGIFKALCPQKAPQDE
ncbi:energy transducer TonB [Bradyrhizobium sediminis]|nr:energy transducer TonB [Bradyrhizobium sediminis]